MNSTLTVVEPRVAPAAGLAGNASHYAERFTWEHIAATTRDVYRAALDGRRS